MISERLLTHVMDWQNRRQLRTQPYVQPRLPGPTPGSKYMLYAHVPFCERLCPYCSFNRYPFHAGRARRYFSALRDELRMIADQGFDFESLYIGGGTPTAQLDELCATIDLARDLFSIKEVSTETNPNHLSAAYAEELAPRVHRLSVGVQSFDDGLLIQMDRYDKYGSGEWILQRLQDMAGVFDSLNVDLIFGIPGQTLAVWRETLKEATAMGSEHLSSYEVIYEEDTPLYDQLVIYLMAAAFLLAVGIFGLLRRRTLIGMLISGELRLTRRAGFYVSVWGSSVDSYVTASQAGHQEVDIIAGYSKTFSGEQARLKSLIR